ncbi:hypothetical protein DFH09DRAFT_1079144 [Mycena vulgaris]|nr:hypothetical protein DFH09DRAFT_1079144 [Mycena vulgaris]
MIFQSDGHPWPVHRLQSPRYACRTRRNAASPVRRPIPTSLLLWATSPPSIALKPTYYGSIRLRTEAPPAMHAAKRTTLDPQLLAGATTTSTPSAPASPCRVSDYMQHRYGYGKTETEMVGEEYGRDTTSGIGRDDEQQKTSDKRRPTWPPPPRHVHRRAYPEHAQQHDAAPEHKGDRVPSPISAMCTRMRNERAWAWGRRWWLWRRRPCSGTCMMRNRASFPPRRASEGVGRGEMEMGCMCGPASVGCSLRGARAPKPSARRNMAEKEKDGAACGKVTVLLVGRRKA